MSPGKSRRGKAVESLILAALVSDIANKAMLEYDRKKADAAKERRRKELLSKLN